MKEKVSLRGRLARGIFTRYVKGGKIINPKSSPRDRSLLQNRLDPFKPRGAFPLLIVTGEMIRLLAVGFSLHDSSFFLMDVNGLLIIRIEPMVTGVCYNDDYKF
jgi:hypothetical protein